MSEFSLNNQVSIKNPHSRVSKWWGPYNSITEAKTATAAVRNIGFPVGIMQDGYVVEHIWQKVDDDFDFVSETENGKEQIVDSGGNYNDLEVDASTLIFTNENAQAILNGIVSKVRVLTIINRSTQFLVRINSESESAGAGAKKISLPSGLAQVGVKGVITLRYSDSLEMYEIKTSHGIPFAPEHLGIENKAAQVVNPDGSTETMDFEEIESFLNAQSTPLTNAQLNAQFEEANVGFEAVCPLIGIIYKKMDNSSTGVWQPIHYGATEWQQITLDATYVVSGNLYVKKVAGRILLSSNGLLEFTGSVDTTNGSIIGTIPTSLRFDTTKQIALKCVNGNNITCFITLAGEIKVYRAGQVYVQEELTQFTGIPS